MEVSFLYVSNDLSLLTMPLSLGNTPAGLAKRCTFLQRENWEDAGRPVRRGGVVTLLDLWQKWSAQFCAHGLQESTPFGEMANCPPLFSRHQHISMFFEGVPTFFSILAIIRNSPPIKLTSVRGDGRKQAEKSLFSIFFFGMKLAKEHCKKKAKGGNCLPYT